MRAKAETSPIKLLKDANAHLRIYPKNALKFDDTSIKITKKAIKIKDANTLYLKMEDGLLQYTVFTPNGQFVTASIDADMLTSSLTEPLMAEELKPLLPGILRITAERGHTHGYDSFYNNHIIGDLHGNALKYIHFVLTNGLISWSRENYHVFSNIYDKDIHAITAEDIKILEQILSEIIYVVPKAHILRSIGDDLCDRGKDDFMSLLLVKSYSQNLDLRTMHSNHTAEFILANQTAEEGQLFNSSLHTNDWGEFSVSAKNMDILFQKDLINLDDINNIMINHYYPSLRVVDYSVVRCRETGQQGLMIYTHALSDLSTLKQLIEVDLKTCFLESEHQDMCFVYKDATVNDLIDTIKEINRLANLLVVDKKFAALNGLESFQEIIWNREQAGLCRDQRSAGLAFPIWFCHGHHKDVLPEPTVWVIDEYFGKHPAYEASTRHNPALSLLVKGLPTPERLVAETTHTSAFREAPCGKANIELPEVQLKSKASEALSSLGLFDKQSQKARQKRRSSLALYQANNGDGQTDNPMSLTNLLN